MATKKPISTISFNTQAFLVHQLQKLVNEDKAQSWIFIQHYAEKDTTKDHFHVLVVPASPLDPQRIRRRFIEPRLGEKDLGCLPFQPSKVGDWLLYALHDQAYLTKKGLERVNHYRLENLVTNEGPEWIENIYNEAVETFTDSRLATFLSEMDHGSDFSQLLASGLVPPNQVVFYEKLYKSNQWRVGRSLDVAGNDSIPF